MHDFHLDNMVVYSNVLIKSMWKMNASTIKLFAMAVSCIDTMDPPKDLTVRISKKDIWDMYGLTGSARNIQFQTHVTDLQSQKVIIPLDQAGKRVAQVVPVPYVEFGTKDDDNLVLIRFDQAIMPYLIDLKGHFTQFQINQLKGIRGKYSMILFQYLSMNHNMIKKQLKKGYNPEKGIHWTLEIENLRKLTDTITDYPQFERFEFWVLKESLKEINGVYMPLVWKYEKIKKGRRVAEIKFFVRDRLSFGDNEFDKAKPIKKDTASRNLDNSLIELTPEQEEVFQKSKAQPPKGQTSFEDFGIK